MGARAGLPTRCRWAAGLGAGVGRPPRTESQLWMAVCGRSLQGDGVSGTGRAGRAPSQANTHVNSEQASVLARSPDEHNVGRSAAHRLLSVWKLSTKGAQERNSINGVALPREGPSYPSPGAPDPGKILPWGPLQAAVMPVCASVCITPTLTLLKKSRLPSPL